MRAASETNAMSAPDEALIGAFRGAMRRLASGVCLVTTTDDMGAPCGIAMTAVMSLSMEPPSLLLAINRTASLCAPLLANGRLGISVLARSDEQLCRDFVAAPPATRFSHGDWSTAQHGIPLLGSALAGLVCTVDKAEPFGSHMVIHAVVDYVALDDASDALVYLDGRYGGMRSDD